MVLQTLISGGWMMIPLLLCSVVALAVILDRLWFLQAASVAPAHLRAQVLARCEKKAFSEKELRSLEQSSPLGTLFAVGIVHIQAERQDILKHIEEAGRYVVHRLEKHLSLLGIIASISPFLGLLGTVLGIIRIFATLHIGGVGSNGALLAGGISEALVCTAAGLVVAIPSLGFYYYFQRRVDDLSLSMEQETAYFVDSLKILSAGVPARSAALHSQEMTRHAVSS